MKRVLLIALGIIILIAAMMMVYIGSAGHGDTDPPVRRSIDIGMLFSFSPFIITALILITYNIYAYLKEKNKNKK